ncbi:hypothetical protein L810_4040 [Burkholderia sp. AU4i]|nr:hypothetical protein L810_4040 [Burkholderia sp. AU4i]
MAPTPATPDRSVRSRRTRTGMQRTQAGLGWPDARIFE